MKTRLGLLLFLPALIVSQIAHATGEVIWEYDPEVDGAWAANGCCDVVNRGVAVWDGKVFIGTYDGRLVVLDGTLADNGMAGFAAVLDADEADAVRAYVLDRAHALMEQMAGQ